MITQSINQLNAIAQTIEILRKEMHRLAKLLPKYPAVIAIFGISDTIAAQLMAKIGDVRRFCRRGSLIAFAGIDPWLNQLGQYNAKSTSISKWGCSELRKILYQIMAVYLMKSPENESVYQFLSKKRQEGKPYFVYMTAGANKVLRIYFGRVKEYLKVMN